MTRPPCSKRRVFNGFFLWRVTFWRCRDLQAWFVSRTRFLAHNFNSLCVCCSLSESRSFLLYFTIPGDISCCLCSEMGRTKAQLKAKANKLRQAQERAKGSTSYPSPSPLSTSRPPSPFASRSLVALWLSLFHSSARSLPSLSAIDFVS